MKQLLRLLAVFLITLSASPAQNPAPAAPAAAAVSAAPAGPSAQTPAAPVAQTPAAPAKPAEQGRTMSQLIEEGGVTIYFLIALSVVMCALVAFYLLTIRRGAVVSDYFMRTADALIRKQDYLGLLSECSRRNECIASITHKAIDFATKNPTATFAEVREVTESEGQRQATQLSQRIAYLADVGAVAPMIGLLGTVIGIMKEFSRISTKDMISAQMEFAGGTAEALINTAAGLTIAIPSMIIYSIYKGRVNSLISELESAATHIMALLGAQYKRVAAQARAAQQQAAAAQPAPRQGR